MCDTKTVLTPDCGVHCGADRAGNAPLYIGHCKCAACKCPHQSRWEK